MRETQPVDEKRRDLFKGAALAVASFSALDIGLSDIVKAAEQGESQSATDLAPYTRPAEVHPVFHYAVEPEAEVNLTDNSVIVNPNFLTRHTVCLGCRSHCGIRVKIDTRTGRIVRIYGNPYDVHSTTSPLPPETSIQDSFKVFSQNLFTESKRSDKTLAISNYTATTCARGIAHIQYLYDPYRNLAPMKRSGPRGSGKWKTIPWEQLIDEVSKGGKLFSDAGEDDEYWGFYDVAKDHVDPTALISDLYNPTDAKNILTKLGDAQTRKKLFSDLKAKLQTDSDFRTKYADKLIDPNKPEYGSKANQLVFMGGRITEVRGWATQWFIWNSFGSENWMEHTNICEATHHTIHALWSRQSQAGSNHFKPDIRNAEFIIFWGTSPGNAGFPMQTMQKFTAVTRSKGNFSYAVVDPVLNWSVSQSGGTASWVPIKPGTDSALALAMIRWIIENNRYNQNLLQIPNMSDAKKSNETTCTDASYLVVTAPNDHPKYGQKLAPADLGLQGAGYVAIDGVTGQLNSATNISRAQLDYEGQQNLQDGSTVTAKTVFKLLKESSTLGETTLDQTLAKAEQITGVPIKQITWLADEFTKHGRRAAVTFYRGPIKHQNGSSNALSLLYLNLLIGNVNRKGGYVRFFSFANKPGPRYNVNAPPNAKETWGVRISREPSRGRLTPKTYEETNEFGISGYPSKRPWFYLPDLGGSNVFSEILPSHAAGYPYSAKVILLHMANPLYTTPIHFREDLVTQLRQMTVDGKRPLIVSSDTVINETTGEIADYVIPDGTYFEYWNINSVFGAAAPNRGDRIMWPVIEPLARDDKREYSTEQFLLDVALKLSSLGLRMPGSGDQAIADKDGVFWPLRNREDYYLKAIANMAYNIEPITNVASAMDLQITGADEVMKKHQDSLKQEEWPKILFVISRGAKLSDPYNLWDGEVAKFRSEGTYRFYIEEIGTLKNSMTGKNFKPMAEWHPSEFSAGGAVDDVDKAYPFKIVTYKPPIMTHSRTPNLYWLLEVNPENWVEMNHQDANNLGISDGDRILVQTPEGKTQAKAKVREGIQPGVLAFMVGYGHWWHGARDYQLGDMTIKGDERRGTGVQLNPIMRTDPTVQGMPMAPIDLVGGSTVFFETRATVTKV